MWILWGLESVVGVDPMFPVDPAMTVPVWFQTAVEHTGITGCAVIKKKNKYV